LFLTQRISNFGLTFKIGSDVRKKLWAIVFPKTTQDREKGCPLHLSKNYSRLDKPHQTDPCSPIQNDPLCQSKVIPFRQSKVIPLRQAKMIP